jgi:hypothetical protein
LKDLGAALPTNRYAEIQQIIVPQRQQKRLSECDRTAIEAVDASELTAFYVAEFIKEKLYIYVNMQRFMAKHRIWYPHGERVVAYLRGRSIIGFSHRVNFISDLLCSLAYLGTSEFTAIQLLILAETGFNPQPLRDLHISQCEREKGQTARWKLLPTKEKTGKGQDQSLYSSNETSEEKAEYIVKIANKSDGIVKRTAFDAMEMLKLNYDRLLESWSFAPDSEGYLISCPIRLNDFLAQRLRHSWPRTFRKFKQQWDINPNYTFKQLRSQVGCQVVVRSNGNLYAVKNKLGHSDIATSARYAAEVLAGLDEVIINQFERQIAATIMFAIGGDDVLYAHSLQHEDINVKMIPIVTLKNKPAKTDDIKQKLTSVGNGVGCTDPTNSPNHTIKPGDFCDGEQCHGCEQQKIIITEGRMKENILMLRYFRNNLEEICSRNPEHWIVHGVKAFAFQIALSHVIRSNERYKGLYDEIERQVTKE